MVRRVGVSNMSTPCGGSTRIVFLSLIAFAVTASALAQTASAGRGTSDDVRPGLSIPEAQARVLGERLRQRAEQAGELEDRGTVGEVMARVAKTIDGGLGDIRFLLADTRTTMSVERVNKDIDLRG